MTTKPKQQSPDTLLPKGRVLEVTFKVALPAAASLTDIDEWAQVVHGHKTHMRSTNPLSSFADQPMESVNEVMLNDTGRRLMCKATPKPEGGFSITSWTEPDPGNQGFDFHAPFEEAIAAVREKNKKPLTFSDDTLTEAQAISLAKAVWENTASEDDAERLRKGVVLPAMIVRCDDCETLWKVVDLPCEAMEMVRIMDRAHCPQCGEADDLLADQSARAVAWWVLSGRYG